MKKVIYALMVPLVVVSGLLFAHHEIGKEKATPSASKAPAAAERQTELQKWEASPAGIQFKQWEASPEGQKVLAGAAKIRKPVTAFTDMEAIVTSLSLPPGSRLGFGVMARINGEDYILSFGPETADEFQHLHQLKVDDKIIIKSHFVSYAPKYAYPIVAGDYVERAGKIMYKRAPRKGGC